MVKGSETGIHRGTPASLLSPSSNSDCYPLFESGI